jgi:outer membrane cobalamin receptor
MKHTLVISVAAVLIGGVPLEGMAQQRAVATTLTESGVDRHVAERLLARPVTITLDRSTVQQAITAIGRSAGVHVQYHASELNAFTARVTLRANRMPFGDALAHVLAGTSLQAVVVTERIVNIQPAARSSIADGAVTGVVTEGRTKQPMRGVLVTLDDAVKQVTADDGRFRFVGLGAGSHRVAVRMLGFARQSRTVEVGEGSVTVSFVLDASMTALDQVVVTGTVIPTEQRAVPNAMTVITAKQIEERGITQIQQLFRGEVPGLFAQRPTSESFVDEVVMFSRGATALDYTSAGVSGIGNTNPIKTYVDGIELANPKYLSQIDPKSIERIEILTGPQASTIYGSNAINGVMQIFTKRGTTARPQLTVSLLSGWMQNNFSSAYTPQHDVNARLSGIEGRFSYSVGGSWNYIGRWTPARQTTRTGADGGGRLSLAPSIGVVTADVTYHHAAQQNQQRGNIGQTNAGYRDTGWYRPVNGSGLSKPLTHIFDEQMLGLALSMSPASWWSHELNIGQDVLDVDNRSVGRGYQSVSDTALQFNQTHTNRRSLRYTTTAQLPLSSVARWTVTVGGDAWQRLTTGLTVVPQTLTGTLAGATFVSRQPEHNTGGFLQTQLGVADRLFITYGLRTEWNPNFGAAAEPNYARRYGVAYAQDAGALTMKLRAAYGRATRPPAGTQKLAVLADSRFDPTDVYGLYDTRIANAALGPEYQQGVEGGVELYLGQRASLVVTRHNQTVDALITSVPGADSVRSLQPNPVFFGGSLSSADCLAQRWGGELCSSQDATGYMYALVGQNINVGSIRNQGWALEGNINTGPFTTRGTYSWTKSRVIGTTPAYRSRLPARDYPQYQPGATFQYLPEHTWSVGITYASARTTVAANVSGAGQIMRAQTDFYLRNLSADIRLPLHRFNVSDRGYMGRNNGYALGDVTAMHRLFGATDATLRVQNVANNYTNDTANGVTVGRQMTAGVRVRW